jgi:hypothetical protein
MPDPSCLSYWLPKLLEASVPVPRTETVRTGADLVGLLESKTPDGFDALLQELHRAALAVGGYPSFLRTDHGSGKHDWRHTCCFPGPEDLARHVGALVDWSAESDFLGLLTDVWVVRELLPVRPVAVLPRYGDMPLVLEVRGFVADGHRTCFHPYWPARAIPDGLVGRPGLLPEEEEAQDAAERLKRAEPLFRQVGEGVTEERTAALHLIDRVATVFRGEGAWSLDLLLTDRSWYVTDLSGGSGALFPLDGVPGGGLSGGLGLETRHVPRGHMLPIGRRRHQPPRACPAGPCSCGGSPT